MNLTPTTAVELADQPCVGAVTAVTPMTLSTISGAADRLPCLRERLLAVGAVPSQAPFLRDRMIDTAGDLVVEAGGPYSGTADVPLLDDATARLLARVADRGAAS